MNKPTTIKIDEVEYIRKDQVSNAAAKVDGMTYVIVRTENAGVFAGYMKLPHSRKTGTIYQARRLWYWSGAASLSQLAVDGVKNPKECKFPVVVEEITVMGIIEIIPATEAALISIKQVPIWQV